VARFTNLPRGYDPWLVLSVREVPEGGDLAVAVKCDPPLPLSSTRHLVILVHGFNNHLGEAAEAYLGFRERQYPLAGVLPPALEPGFGDFFWPGDADWAWLLDKADFLIYPAAVRKAPGAGERLAMCLAEMPNLVTVDFVGHSLGCRVVLECIRALLGGRHPVIRRVVLMAAAVPDFMVVPPHELARAAGAAESVVVLHSTSDTVLHFAFAPGQTAAGAGEGVLPTALGRFGPPAGMAGRVEPHRVMNAGHGDYWGKSIDKASKEVVRSAAAAHIADALRLGQLAREVASVRRPDAGAPTADPREVSTRRFVAERGTTWRAGCPRRPDTGAVIAARPCRLGRLGYTSGPDGGAVGRAGGWPIGWRFSMAAATARASSSRPGGATTCRPAGSPRGSRPAGTAATGSPVMLHTNVGAIQST
jgi:hypothetical protein